MFFDNDDEPREEPRRPEPGPDEFAPLAEPFHAPNGLVVGFPSSVAELQELGRHFNNALMDIVFARHYVPTQEGTTLAGTLAYQVSRDGVPVSCGEIGVKGDLVVAIRDRAHGNGPGTPETIAAVEAFVEAANAGSHELNYDVADNGLRARATAPSP